MNGRGEVGIVVSELKKGGSGDLGRERGGGEW